MKALLHLSAEALLCDLLLISQEFKEKHIVNELKRKLGNGVFCLNLTYFSPKASYYRLIAFPCLGLRRNGQRNRHKS